MNVLVVSLRYNPGHFSSLIANYNLFMDYGFKPYMYINKSFNKMDETNKYRIINNFKHIKKLKSVEEAVFWFPSFYNIIIIMRLRVLYRTKIIYILHEPFDSIKNYYRSGFGLIKILKIAFINLINVVVIILSHKVILPSSKAFNIYKKDYFFYNNNFSMVPLIFDDEAKPLLKLNQKKFISYIGTISADHAFDLYVNFIITCIKNNWFDEYYFLIATKNKIPLIEKEKINSYIQSGKITISEGNPMSNELINSFYNQSLIVWNAYNRSMQSGVLSKAYMFGAAVIGAYDSNYEFIENHKTGVLVYSNKDVIEIKNAVKEILDNKIFFSLNSRNKFLEYFHYKNRVKDFIF